MKWSGNYKVNAHDTDLNNIVSLTGILRYMQDSANCQMEHDGLSYNELFNRGFAFVLSRIKLSLYQPIYSHDEIEVSTWACESSGVSFNRSYCIKKDGVIVAEAYSIWALVDTNAHKLVRVCDFEGHYGEDSPVELDMQKRFRLPADITLTLVGERTVEYQDVDMNRHMNNTKYGDILCGYLPEIAGNRVIQFEINYISEAPLGESLKVYMAKSNDGNYYFRTVREGGKTNIEAELMIENI
ncbi:MAG: hypothetical protein IJD22_06470 [Clostridia bacterium]|nr:hypothetical protein [Clostridia bacterium]